MMFSKRIAVVMPAYNAAKTLAATVSAIPPDVVDDLILVDDASQDDTVAVARSVGLDPIVHPKNRGYGGNQKTCYQAALDRGADIVIMLHPDLQYDPRLIPAMASLIALDRYDIVLGTRMSGRGPLHGGMPLYKFISNRLLTRAENALTGWRLSEYHTGYRAYSRSALEAIPWHRNDEGFLFDNQFLVQAIHLDLDIGEVACPAHYPPDASSIRFWPALEYGLGVLDMAVRYRLHRSGLLRSPLLEEEDR
jgi:glycosyltransferase involved in cell wall biosynthesis